jgi:hypothetical protein
MHPQSGWSELKALCRFINSVAAVMQHRQFLRYWVIRSSLAYCGAEKQNVQSHREPEQDSSQQQPLCPCHGFASNFVVRCTERISKSDAVA